MGIVLTNCYKLSKQQREQITAAIFIMWILLNVKYCKETTQIKKQDSQLCHEMWRKMLKEVLENACDHVCCCCCCCHLLFGTQTDITILTLSLRLLVFLWTNCSENIMIHLSTDKNTTAQYAGMPLLSSALFVFTESHSLSITSVLLM